MRPRRSRVASATFSSIRSVHAANIQDPDGVAMVLDHRTRRLFPFIERIYGDGGYQGPKAERAAVKTGSWIIEIVGSRRIRNLTQAATLAVKKMKVVVQKMQVEPSLI
jgi:hypothetical protein